MQSELSLGFPELTFVQTRESSELSLPSTRPQTMLRRVAPYRHMVRSWRGNRLTGRPYSSPPPPPPPPTSRIARVESRLPRFLQRIVVPLRNAPISHITAFVILHEITAIVPLIGLAGAFHYYNWLPPYISEWKWAHEGMTKYGNYMRKKGWIKDDTTKGRWWGRGEGGMRLLAEVATAYAITKGLLPLRLVVSVWGSPWFARWAILPISGRISGLFSRTKNVKTATTASSGASGTGAVGAGVLPKEVRPPP